MQLYFVKATYTNNVYKLSDFFLSGDYKLNANKMLDINFRPDDGISSFITKHIELPDSSSIREHTHIIVPDFGKIYKIAAVDYNNIGQAVVTLDDDPFIGSYQELEDEDIIMTRLNDPDYFRGVNDIADITLKETVETKVFSSESMTGKWALIFLEINSAKTRYGLNFENYIAIQGWEQFTTITDVTNAYPEVETETPNLYSYFQKIVFVATGLQAYQCVQLYDGQTSKLYWVEYSASTITERWFEIEDAIGGRFSQADVRNIIIALPYEYDIKGHNVGTKLLSFQNFVGPSDSGEVIDIKIVDDILLPDMNVSYSTNLLARTSLKTISSGSNKFKLIDVYASEGAPTLCTTCSLMSVLQVETDIVLDPEYISSDPVPLDAEPFNKYDLVIFGKKFTIPYYLTDDIHLLIAINSGVINYTVYYNDKRNVIGAGSFTHSLRYLVDKLDQFYNQNPTYKDQFFIKMGVDAVKTAASGAIGGSVIPGLGTVAGAGIGIASAGVDAGLSLVNLHYQEKGLRLQPDQIFGEISEVSMQLLNIFGIYFVKRISENADLMETEYGLRGFPTEIILAISDLDYSTSFFGSSKVIYGELKTVIKNEYTTSFINLKLKEGIVLIA